MSLKLALPQGLSFLRSVRWLEDRKVDSAAKQQLSPTLKLQTDKEVYRPGDSVTVTIEIHSPASLKDDVGQTLLGEDASSLLLDALPFELKGIEKLGSQWFSVPKPLPGSKQRLGEHMHMFLDCSAPSLVSKVIIASGQTKTYIVRVELPKILPPSYRGISIRYFYYVRSTLFGRLVVLGNGEQNKSPVKGSIRLIHSLTTVLEATLILVSSMMQHYQEARVPLQIRVSQKTSSLLNEEGTWPFSVDQLGIYWREKDEDSEWTETVFQQKIKANDNVDLEGGYDSSKDEVSSVSSYNHSKANPESSLRNSSSMQSLTSRLSTSEPFYNQVERPNFPSYNLIPRLSVSEISDDHDGGLVSPQRKPNHLLPDHPSNGQRFSPDSDCLKDDAGVPLTPKNVGLAGSEGFTRGRSYNIRIDDQVLLRFSPKNSDSTYYFGDMIGGALTFFHGTGKQRCLEVSITLETSETINPRALHPSRRGSPIITKLHSEHHEVVADLHQTSFLFSIPIDGPMSFATSKVTVQWSLRFEFFITPEGTDPNRYEHPLLVDKGEWVLPVTVYAPPLRRRPNHGRNDRSVLSGNIFNS